MLALTHHYLMDNQVDLAVAAVHILEQDLVVVQLVVVELVVTVHLVLILHRLVEVAVVLLSWKTGCLWTIN